MAAIDKENLYVISGDIYLVSFVALEVFTKIGYLYSSCWKFMFFLTQKSFFIDLPLGMDNSV
jgi:hypothetical protein